MSLRPTLEFLLYDWLHAEQLTSRTRTHGIQAADLLGRKVLMEGGKGLSLLAARMAATIERTMAHPVLAEYASALRQALAQVQSATQAAWATGNPAEALAKAVPYMQAFGHMVVAWIWLDVAARRDPTCAQMPEAAF